jgi:predicted amidohydrolase YtcJ
VSTRGDIPLDELATRMLPFWEADIQIYCHANGGEAIDVVLDALTQVQRIPPRLSHRFSTEHYAVSRPNHARRLRSAGRYRLGRGTVRVGQLQPT